MNQTRNMREQIIRVLEHWAEQRDVKVDELIFRIRSAPLRPEVVDWDPIHQTGTIDVYKNQAS